MSEVVAEGIGAPSVPMWVTDVYTPICREAKLHFNDDGISVRAVEPANVAMHFLELDQTAFEHWDSPGSVTVGVNLETLEERLTNADKDSDVATMAVDMETRKLHVDTDNIKQRVAMIDPDSVRQEPDLPDLDFTNTAVLSAGKLQRAIGVVDQVSDHIDVAGSVEDECVRFVGEGDKDDSAVEYGRDELLEGTSFDATEESKFSTQYLEKLTKPVPKDAEVTIKFSDQMPIRFEWTALDGSLSVTSMCAPRV